MPKKTLVCTALIALAAAWSGCAGAGEDPQSAIRAAVDRHLANRGDLDFSQMQVDVEQIDFEGESRAKARVSFRVGDSPDAGMEMVYQLSKTDGRWEVEGTAGGGQGAHGAAPPMAPQGQGELPPNHPPAGGESAGELPQGHPPLED